MFKPTKFSLLPADVRAATVKGADIDVVELAGLAMAILDAEAQGSGITLNAKLQSSPALARGLEVLTVGTNNIPLRHGAADNVKLAAAFTQDGAGQIKRVALMLRRAGTIAAGKVVSVTIEADDSGAPSGTPLATAGNVAADTMSTDYGFVVFEFATPVDLADATVYHIVLQGDYTASATNQVQWRAATVASGGNSEVYDSAWAAVDTNDLELYTDQYVFADIADAAFAEVGNAASFQELFFNVDQVGGVVRAVGTVAGGSATGASAVILLGNKQTLP